MALVRPPRTAHVEIVALTVEQARALLAAAASNRFEALFILALKTGMRRGELLALRWDDVDLDKGMLQVRGTLRRTREGLTVGTPKTAASRRKVVLSPTSMAALRRHQVRQDEERRTAGDLWQDFGLVFPNTVGRPMEPRDLLLDVYRPLLKRAGLLPGHLSCSSPHGRDAAAGGGRTSQGGPRAARTCTGQHHTGPLQPHDAQADEQRCGAHGPAAGWGGA